jgi:hypothetical protein
MEDNTQIQFGYSEFSRIASTSKSGLQFDVPKILAYRLLARYKAETINDIKGVERLYVYSSDTLDSASASPLAVIKSSITMRRA